MRFRPLVSCVVAFAVGVSGLALQGCNALFGGKDDVQTDEIFEEGRIDPSLVPTGVGYVPVQPGFYGFNAPTDVYVGYDELLYVTDAQGLHICDLTGARRSTINLRGATKVVQDRRLHTYVAARIDYQYEGTTYDLPAVFHFSSTASGNIRNEGTLIFPFADPTRQFTLNSTQLNDDEQTAIGGITTFADNRLAVARRGNGVRPVSPGSTTLPDDAVLFFSPEGRYVSYANGLNPNGGGLRGIRQPSGIASFAAPPQSVFGISTIGDFIVTLQDSNAEYRVLWIRENFSPDAGTVYTENAALLNQDTSRALGFLYEGFRFSAPSDVAIAPDATGYIFITDQARDSLYVFDRRGYEGVTPPAISGLRKQALVSFGGKGVGPFQFNAPSGVAYFRRTVYVADKGNNRIVRYRLSTDLEQ